MKRIAIIIIILLAPDCAPKYQIDHSFPTNPIKFPEDHAAHYRAQTEWWYYTGHLEDDNGEKFGFEVTFFKRILSEDRAPWFLLYIPAYWIKDVGIFGHFAISDFTGKKFYFRQMGNILHSWHADSRKFDLRLDTWRAREVGGSHLLEADMDDFSIELKLTPVKPPVLHGRDGILVKDEENANYYYSFTNMKVEGILKTAEKNRTVKGKAWMDHEYGKMKMTKKSWDWFSIQFENNEELMLYIIKENGRIIKESGGTFIYNNGITRQIKLSDLKIETLNTWYSKESETTYPSMLDIYIKSLDLKFKVASIFPEQELDVFPVTYWEGGVTANGTHGGRPVKGHGYAEFAGYDRNNSFDKYIP